MPASIRVPNFLALCDRFDLRCSPHCRAVTASAEKWAMSDPQLFLDRDEEHRLPGARLGLLASLCYPSADPAQLLTIAKLLIVLEHWTSRPLSLYADEDVFDQLWTKSLRPAMRRDWQKRFQRHLAAFRLARATSSHDGAHGIVPDLESYLLNRRDASGAKMFIDLIAFAGSLEIHPQLYDMPLLRRLREDAADVISWTEDVAEYTRCPTNSSNLVVVLMVEKGLTAQGAMHYAGNLVKDTIGNFIANERLLASCGVDRDSDVRAYVQGLRNCMVGTLHWIYETDRFFGDARDDVRASGWVFLS